MKIFAIIFYIWLLLLPISLYPQVSSLMEEESAAFSYYKRSVDQLGFKDCPEAMAITNGGIFSNSFAEVEFLYGKDLKTAAKRVILFEEDYLPLIHYELSEGNITYKMNSFSVPDDFKPENNLITFVRWTIENTGDKALEARLGFRLTPLYETGWKEYTRHNRYCTPWYRDQFMNINLYENNQHSIELAEGCLFQGGHMLLCYPETFTAVPGPTEDSLQWSDTFTIPPGGSEELVFRIPVVPVDSANTELISGIRQSDAGMLRKELIKFWKNELDAIAGFFVPEQKVMSMFRTSYINLMTAKDLLADKTNTIQRCNEFQYDHFYVRDNAYFARVYDMLGMHETSLNILQPYFIYDIEGKPIHFRQRTGIYNKLCHDYWGQVLWAFGSHYRQTRNKELLRKVFELLPNHIKEFRLAVEMDPRGLWPVSWPYDNENINGHYTGHNFWAILGLRYAIFMAQEMGEEQDAKDWKKLYNDYYSNFKQELEKITAETGGYIPPGMDDPEDGYDWANASAGLYPFEALSKDNPSVRTTLETVRNYNFMEGISTYSGCNALVAKNRILNNQELPERGLHHYETFYVTNGNLILGEQKKVVEDLYSILVHTSSTHAGFEWRPLPWENRDPGFNRQPHGWCAARYIELLRNMLVREEGSDIHLLSAVSPEWIREGEMISVTDAPTYFGEVTYHLNTGKNKFIMNLDARWNNDLGKIYIHIPWFIDPDSVFVDNRLVVPNENILEIPAETQNIIVSWGNDFPETLNFSAAVNIFLDKYYNKPPEADYVHLFPTLSATGVSIDESGQKLSLFSPDQYADVYYTTDGSEPGITSIKYNKPIKLKRSNVIKAVCIDTNGNTSDCKTIFITP